MHITHPAFLQLPAARIQPASWPSKALSNQPRPPHQRCRRSRAAAPLATGSRRTRTPLTWRRVGVCRRLVVCGWWEGEERTENVKHLGAWVRVPRPYLFATACASSPPLLQRN